LAFAPGVPVVRQHGEHASLQRWFSVDHSATNSLISITISRKIEEISKKSTENAKIVYF